jgi:regulator of replication initiation timing
MNKIEVKTMLQGISQEVESIEDKKTVSILNTLINLVEMLVEENAQLKKENQDLKDKVNRLKGEQGKPDIKGKNQSSDHSSEKERKVRQPQKPRKPRVKKKSIVAVDREVTCELDKTNLPDDLIFKGYETRVVQDLKISTDNVRFKLRTYYSPSIKKTFIAPLPNSYNGQFGPVIKSLVITLYRDSGMTESAISTYANVIRCFDP